MSRTFGSVDAANFGIDLSAANAARRELAKYVDHGTRVTPQKTGRSPANRPASGPHQVQVIRERARQNGYTVSTRGRISQSIQDAFGALSAKRPGRHTMSFLRL
jgi:hypothetical protein